MKTVIIGGVAGGASTATRLRRLDEYAEIIILEKGSYVSFANCGLPYYIGGDIIDKSKLTLHTPQSFKARFNIDVRINNQATHININQKCVTVKNLTTGEEYLETYDNLVLSPGATPIIPTINGINSPLVFTLRNIPDTYKIKDYISLNHIKSVTVVGGGYIGVEMAENLKKLGLNVTIVELADHVIAPLDFDMACDVHRHIREQGINLILNNAVTELVPHKSHLTVKLSQGEFDTDILIMSVGVRPETEIASQCGISINQRRSIIVNSQMMTNIPNIYAVGDAVEVVDFISKKPAFIPLAGPANKQGRIVADNIMGLNSHYLGTQGSAVLKLFDMTIASTGLNEKTAIQNNTNYDKTYIVSNSHASYYPGAKSMIIKALWEKDSHKLLGAQIVGYDGVDKRMDVIATAIRFNAKITDLTQLELCYAPPFSSAKDPVNMLGFVAENVINHKVNQFFPEDVALLPQDGSVTLLDVRTAKEVESGTIKGFIHIPVDDLRENINKLDKNKPIYVHCLSGLRSYIACRILAGYGFTCYHLAGGWKLYESFINERKVKDYACY